MWLHVSRPGRPGSRRPAGSRALGVVVLLALVLPAPRTAPGLAGSRAFCVVVIVLPLLVLLIASGPARSRAFCVIIVVEALLQRWGSEMKGF